MFKWYKNIRTNTYFSEIQVIIAVYEHMKNVYYYFSLGKFGVDKKTSRMYDFRHGFISTPTTHYVEGYYTLC